MSDCTRNRFNEKEDSHVLLGKGNPGESPCQQNSRWMAHWTKASSSAYGKSCSPLEGANDSTCTKDSLFELKKSSVAERLTFRGNYEGLSMENVQQLNSNMWGVAHDVWQEAEQKKNEQRDGSFQSSVVQMYRDANFYAKTVVSEKLSVRRPSDLPLDFQKLVSSDEKFDSHWNQYPMLSINQKVDCILNPKPRSPAGIVFNDLFVPQQTPMLNLAASKLMELSHQEYELQSHQRADRVMDHCKPAGGIIRLREEPTCLASDPGGKKLKFDNKSLSDCLIDQHDTCHYFANPIQDPLWKCSEKRINLSENNDKSQSVGGASQNQQSRTPAGLHERQQLEKFTDSSKEKSPCLHEILTTPSNLQSSCAKDLFGAQKQFSPKTEKLHGDTQNVSKSSEGITSSLAQKDNGIAINGSQGYNEESRIRNVNQDISSKADFCMPGIEIMDLDPQPFQPSSTRNQVPNSATQPPTPTDPSYRWLKRLYRDVPYPRSPPSKRPKTGDCCPVGGASRMSDDTDMADHVEARSVHCWVGRWCWGGGYQKMKASVKPNIAAKELRRQFPSIKAMAMMGRVMTKARPLDRERKGPCVMWKSE